MNDQFQHVMVLTSIIIGLGITYILIGVGSTIERITDATWCPLRLSWAHGYLAGYALCLDGVLLVVGIHGFWHSWKS